MTSTSNQGDVYETITSRIIHQLSNGIVPWKISWAKNGQPQNMLSRNKYRGINAWLLLVHHYKQNLFLTKPQIDQLGAKLKPNEVGYPIIFWKALEGQDKPSIQSFQVYNLEQCTGIPMEKIPVPVKVSMAPIVKCEMLIARMPNRPSIIHDEEDTLYYDPEKDYINIPPMHKFESEALYYKTLFSELVRSAFHSSRIGTKDLEIKQFNAELFTLEALVAEMGASYLASYAGLESEFIEEGELFTKAWIEAFSEDKYLVIRGGTIAQKAVDYIIGDGVKEIEQMKDVTPPVVEEPKEEKKPARKRTASK